MGKLNRRQALKLASGTALSGLVGLIPSAARAAKTDFDVIVVGAGMSGLTAAKALGQLGYDVLIIEARNSPGGRIKTDWSLGAPFEHGAGWIHGPDGNPLSEIQRKNNLQTFVTDDNSLEVFNPNGTEVSDQDLKALDARFAKVAAALEDYDGPDMPLAKALNKLDPSLSADPLFNWALTADTEFDTGGPIENLSTWFYQADAAYDGADVILPGGYEQLLPQLPPTVTTLYGTAVTHIEYAEGEGAEVYCDEQVFYADQVICTLPLGVLKSGAVSFDPPLPSAITGAIAKIPMGNVTKLALKFETPFWNRETQYFGFLTEPKGRWPYALNYRPFSTANILMPLSFGTYAAIAEQMTDEEMVADAMDVLTKAFGQQLPAPIAVKATRWSTDPFTLGAYSYAGFGATPDHFNGFATPVADVLVFAGEHTLFDFHGTAHGAHLSGLRAATAVDDLAE